MSLDELRPGDRAHVARVHCDPPTSRRLMEMGLVPGTPIQLMSIAPLGDPLELELRGYRLSIRRQEARAIRVDVRR